MLLGTSPQHAPSRHSETVKSLILLSLVTMNFVLPIRLASRGSRAVLSAYALMIALYAGLLRFGIQYL